MKLLARATLGVGLLLPHPLLAPPDPNSFARTYNEWVALRAEHHQASGLDAIELRAWQKVKAEWPTFRRMIDEQY